MVASASAAIFLLAGSQLGSAAFLPHLSTKAPTGGPRRNPTPKYKEIGWSIHELLPQARAHWAMTSQENSRAITESRNGIRTKNRNVSRRLVWIRRKGLSVRAIAFFLALGLMQCLASPAFAKSLSVATSTATTASMSQPVVLKAQQVISASLLIIVLGGAGMFRLGLKRLAQDVLVGASRCAFQLYILGSLVLQQLMGATHPWMVGAWIFGVGLVAGQTAFARAKYTYQGHYIHVNIAILTGGLSILAAAIFGNILGPVTPWFRPATVIPVAGMLFGNTLSAAALASSSLTQGFMTQQDQIELRLARGANAYEATCPIVKGAVTTALTPTINSLSVTGLVHVPGMMTGQILAGQSPPQAAAYQAVISFLIAATACTTVQLLTWLISRTLIDHERLQTGKLYEVESKKSKGILTRKNTKKRSRYSIDGDVNGIGAKLEVNGNVTVQITYKNEPQARTPNSELIVELQNFEIGRIKSRLTLSIKEGDRIGVSGRSGIGKSQLLRTLAGLEGWSSGRFLLNGEAASSISLSNLRTRLCYVPQNRPTLEGTPRSFWEEIQGYQNMKNHLEKKQKLSSQTTLSIPGTIIQYLQKWKLSEDVLDQQWSTLSGGEAQRVSLAIALATQPEVLLLDESTSALDESTTKLVEESLIASGIAIVMVSHSSEQLRRVCNREINLSDGYFSASLGSQADSQR